MNSSPTLVGPMITVSQEGTLIVADDIFRGKVCQPGSNSSLVGCSQALGAGQTSALAQSVSLLGTLV
jgi:hypothetical protein